MMTLEDIQLAVGWTEDDAQKVNAVRERLEPQMSDIARRFCDRLEEVPSLHAIIDDSGGMSRMRGSMEGYIRGLLSRPKDGKSANLRRRIGSLHLARGAGPSEMACALSLMRGELSTAIRASFPDGLAADATRSLDRALDLELALLQQGMGAPLDSFPPPLGAPESLESSLVSRLPLSVLLLDEHDRIVTTTLLDPRLTVDDGPFVGRPVSEALAPGLLETSRLVDRVARVRETRRELVLPRVDIGFPHETRAYRITLVPLSAPGSNLLLHLEDLTDGVESEARALRSAYQTQLGTMVTTMAHEVRNPLAGISGTIQVIAASLDFDDVRRNVLDKVQAEIRRLSELMQDLLKFATNVEPTLSLVDLEDVVNEAVERVFEGAAEFPAVEVEGSGTALADLGLVLQIMMNLLENARDAGANLVRVEVRPGEILVDDDGPGIPAESRGQVFEPFFTTRVRGTGLGLPVARKFADSMSGTIDFDETVLGGTAFLLSLPHG